MMTDITSGSSSSTRSRRSRFFTGTAVVIPTYNAAKHWADVYAGLESQGLNKEQILVLDSSSTDGTQELVRRSGYQLKTVSAKSFRHGATRQMAAECLPWADFLIYLTQDAILCTPNSIDRLLTTFSDPKVGAAYGRQLPRKQAKPIERHARLFNYPEQSHVRTFANRDEFGIRAAFFSNSFAAYRRTAFDQVGGFPLNTIVSEDVSVAALMLIKCWKIAYQANATVLHSHSFSMAEEFSRYFDIGVHHWRERHLLSHFAGPGGEGLAFVKSEIRFLINEQPSLIPAAFVRNLNKWCGYYLGLNERTLPFRLKERISAQPNFWRNERKEIYHIHDPLQDTWELRSRRF